LRKRAYPPVPIPPVKPMPIQRQEVMQQYNIKTALQLGTLFKWLYDPYLKTEYTPAYQENQEVYPDFRFPANNWS